MLMRRVLQGRRIISLHRAASSLRLTKQVSDQLVAIKAIPDSQLTQAALIRLIDIADDSDTIIQSLNKLPGCIAIGMKIKLELAELIKSARQDNSGAILHDRSKLPSLTLLDTAMKSWIANVFCYDTIELKTVTFDSASGTVLEKVTARDFLMTLY